MAAGWATPNPTEQATAGLSRKGRSCCPWRESLLLQGSPGIAFSALRMTDETHSGHLGRCPLPEATWSWTLSTSTKHPGQVSVSLIPRDGGPARLPQKMDRHNSHMGQLLEQFINVHNHSPNENAALGQNFAETSNAGINKTKVSDCMLSLHSDI